MLQMLLWLLSCYAARVSSTTCTEEGTCLYGRAAVEYSRGLEPMRARAIQGVHYNTAPVTVQLWTVENDTARTLRVVWEHTIQSEGFFGEQITRLPTPVDITEEHRLGVYFLIDPGPFRPLRDGALPPVYEMLLSDATFPTPGQLRPQVGEVYSFRESLQLPYSYANLRFCNASDCSGVEPATSPQPTEGNAQGQYGDGTTPSSSGSSGGDDDDDSQLQSDGFLLGLLIWLIVMSFVLIAVVLWLCCIYLRPKQQAATQGGVGDVEPEWYVVVDDQNKQLQQPSTSRAVQGEGSHVGPAAAT